MRLATRQLPEEALVRLERLRFLALGHEQQHGGETTILDRPGDRRVMEVGDGAIGDHERGRRAGEVGDVLAQVAQQARTDRHFVGPPWHRDGHTDQRSSSTIAAATAPGSPLPSTTCAANSR